MNSNSEKCYKTFYFFFRDFVKNFSFLNIGIHHNQPEGKRRSIVFVVVNIPCGISLENCMFLLSYRKQRSLRTILKFYLFVVLSICIKICDLVQIYYFISIFPRFPDFEKKKNVQSFPF